MFLRYAETVVSKIRMNIWDALQQFLCYHKSIRKGLSANMMYLLITAGVFLLDLLIKGYMDKKYARKVQHKRCKGKILIEKYYNNGAALNLLAKKPKLMKYIHTLIMVLVCVVYYFVLRITGKKLGKFGIALMTGGGLSNLFDRYTKGHVVDYFRFNIGPKWLRRIIFNISDFCIFIGAVIAVLGSEME